MQFWRRMTSRGEPFEFHIMLLALGAGLAMPATASIWVEAGVPGAAVSAATGAVLSQPVAKALLGVLR